MGDPNAFKSVVTPWVPTSDPIELAILGKLQEELAELQGIVARIIIQGIDEVEPVTKVPNRVALQHEVADVYATLSVTVSQYRLNPNEITERVTAKIAHLYKWHELLREALR